jgi:hypothetical protein
VHFTSKRFVVSSIVVSRTGYSLLRLWQFRHARETRFLCLTCGLFAWGSEFEMRGIATSFNNGDTVSVRGCQIGGVQDCACTAWDRRRARPFLLDGNHLLWTELVKRYQNMRRYSHLCLDPYGVARGSCCPSLCIV